MKSAGVVLLHGYGVRSYMWANLRTALADRLGPTAAPDLSGESISDLISRAKARVRRHSLECDGPVVVVGHSLGAVLAAIAARDLGPDVLSAAVLLAPPYGERNLVPRGLLKFLLRHRLIPPFLLRPRFFSSLTPRPVQRSVFRSAVREHPGVQKLTFETRWFHTDLFPPALEKPALVIASPSDRIVPVERSEEFARALGASVHLFDESLGVAHDDLFASEEIAGTIANMIVSFIAGA